MKRVLIIFCAVLFGATALTGCKRAEQDQGERITSEVAVKVGKVTRATLHRYVVAYGVVEPEPAHNGQPGAGVRLAPASAGIIAEVNCAEGEHVDKGAVLFRLDSRPVDVAVEFATQTYERQKKLLPAGGASQKSLQEAEQQLTAARTQRALLTITAPFSGIITHVNSRPGEAVDLTSVLGELIDPNRLTVTASVPASELDGLKTGQPVEFMVNEKTNAVRGSVSFVSLQVDPKTGASLVRTSVPPEAGLRPGQNLQIRIVSEEKRDRLAVPLESVVKNEQGDEVVAIVDGDKATQRPVKVGLRDGNLVEVEGEGLKEGDTVVTVGAYGLPKETKIKILGQ